jgi:hypothetical protein
MRQFRRKNMLLSHLEMSETTYSLRKSSCKIAFITAIVQILSRKFHLLFFNTFSITLVKAIFKTTFTQNINYFLI